MELSEKTYAKNKTPTGKQNPPKKTAWECL